MGTDPVKLQLSIEKKICLNSTAKFCVSFFTLLSLSACSPYVVKIDESESLKVIKAPAVFERTTEAEENEASNLNWKRDTAFECPGLDGYETWEERTSLITMKITDKKNLIVCGHIEKQIGSDAYELTRWNIFVAEDSIAPEPLDTPLELRGQKARFIKISSNEIEVKSLDLEASINSESRTTASLLHQENNYKILCHGNNEKTPCYFSKRIK